MNRYLFMIALGLITSLDMLSQVNNRIKGVVTDEMREPLIGATIHHLGTNNAAITNVDGAFELLAPVGSTLEISFIGYNPLKVKVTQAMDYKIVLKEDVTQIEDVIVTGVARATKRENMTITVESLKGASIQEVPQVSVAGALQGKLPGIKVYAVSGDPKEEPQIQLRGGMSFFGNQQPLIIVDGVITSGLFKDINMEDVQSLEVIKGAAAASLYGAKAAAGVIQIITKRGSNLGQGTVRVNLKNETGVSWAGFLPLKTSSHGHKIDENGLPLQGVLDNDQIWDNPYIMDADPYEDLFKSNVFTSTTVNLQGRSGDGNTNYYTSFQSTVNPGVIKILKGTTRNSFRINLDTKLSEKVNFSGSNLYVRTINDNRSLNFDDVYYADPNANFLAKNIDGSDYKINPNKVSTRNNINPLYGIANSRSEGVANRFLGNYRIAYSPINDLTFGADYSIDYFNWENQWINPKGNLLVSNPSGDVRSTGSLGLNQGSTFRHSVNASVGYMKDINLLNIAGKVMYMYEDAQSQDSYMGGSNLAINGMNTISMSLVEPKTLYAGNGASRIVNNSITGLVDANYDNIFLLSGLYRYDGSSLIGRRDRWQPYFRFSGAWNVHNMFRFQQIQMLKPRVSYGTAGILPPYGAIFETFNISSGQLQGASQLGNSLLRPALSKELETGIDFRFLNRFDFTFNYSHKTNIDFAYALPVSNAATGFSYQYMNIGEFFVNSYEIMFNANIVNNKKWFWDVTLSWDRFTQRTGNLGVPDFSVGEGVWIRSNSKFGDIYATKLATSLDEVKGHREIREGQSVEDVFTINNYGWVVRKDAIGTRDEARISAVYDNDEDGKLWNRKKGDAKMQKIGNMAPDFTLNLSNNLRWNDFTLYFTASWQQGGYMFNNTAMYMSFAGRNNMHWEMADRPWEQRKAMAYVSHSRGNLTQNTSFLKLREISLNYTFNKKLLSKANIYYINSIKLGVNARNLFTLTNYSGPDPESRTDNGAGGQVITFDTPKYPSDIRNVTGSILVEF